MADEFEQWRVPHRLKSVLHDRASELRKRATPSEQQLWRAISNRKFMGRKFRRQVPIGSFIVDFYCAQERLIIEVDGPIHEMQHEADALRQAALEDMGFQVLRFQNAEVDTQLAGVLKKIHDVICSRP